jgi:Rieske Fe-S protein
MRVSSQLVEMDVKTHAAICPHMKRVVKWNPFDATFDCPSHGSIFYHLGCCINGPGKADLSPLE